MILSVVSLFFLEVGMLCSTLYRIKTDKSLFENIMTTVLITVYFVAIMIYIPLFITVMKRLKLAYPEVHNSIRCQVNLGFACMMTLLLVRFVIYLSIEVNQFELFDISELRNYIPFYISEIIISVAYIFFLIRVHKNREFEVKQKKKLDLMLEEEF